MVTVRDLPEEVIAGWWRKLEETPRDFELVGVFADFLEDHDCAREVGAVRWLASERKWPYQQEDKWYWHSEGYDWGDDGTEDLVPQLWIDAGKLGGCEKNKRQIWGHKLADLLLFVMDNHHLLTLARPRVIN